ncbi:hypothetical protein BsWGS_24457 [Bradybaena similaris]
MCVDVRCRRLLGSRYEQVSRAKLQPRPTNSFWKNKSATCLLQHTGSICPIHMLVYWQHSQSGLTGHACLESSSVRTSSA